ncbi:MAG TPA: DUF2512 family protein [Symbiobacteriaceae bacterium]|nr:DUF2512 family protein [Symbiobacteriaceae bacterium]
MRQAIALGLKLAVYLVVFGLTRPVWGALSLSQSMVLAAVHTLLLWFADMVILPRFGNLAATLGDIVTLFAGTALVTGAMGAVPNPLTVPLAVAAGGAFEWWFHRWLLSTATVE